MLVCVAAVCRFLLMAKIITCQVQVLDGSNINIDVNVSPRGEKEVGGQRHTLCSL